MAATETLETLPGDYLPHVIERALARAGDAGGAVRFTFNGATVEVTGDQTSEEVRAAIETQWEAEAAAYRASPAGIKAAAAAEARLAHYQREHDALTAMPIVSLGEAALVKWVGRYADAADHIGVRGRNTFAVAEALEAAGYARNDACGLPEAEYEQPSVMARYIIGQAIDCLRRGMGPHPVTQKFVDEYRRITAA